MQGLDIGRLAVWAVERWRVVEVVVVLAAREGTVSVVMYNGPENIGMKH